MKYQIGTVLFLSSIACNGADQNAIDPGPIGTKNLEVVENPHKDNAALQGFSTYAEVFGLRVYAEDGFTEAQVLHAVSVLAELIDNDEDGTPDDEVLVTQLQKAGFIMPMFNDEGSSAMRSFEKNYEGDGVSAVLFANEVDPNQPGHWGADASVEEIMHTINHRGHVEIYPEAFGIEPNSSLMSEAMDIARGGQFTSVPNNYPEEAWYHYDDKTCDYGCMAIEYIYWAQVSNMEILNDPDTCAGIANEWEPCSKALLEGMDTRMYALITDPAYKLPQNAPDGIYTPPSE